MRPAVTPRSAQTRIITSLEPAHMRDDVRVTAAYKLVAVDPAGRYRTSFFGGATLSEAAAVTVTATGAPQVLFVVQLPSRRRGVHR